MANRYLDRKGCSICSERETLEMSNAYKNELKKATGSGMCKARKRRGKFLSKQGWEVRKPFEKDGAKQANWFKFNLRKMGCACRKAVLRECKC